MIVPKPTRKQTAALRRKIRLAHAIERYALSQHHLVMGFDCLFNLTDLVADEVAAHAADPHPTSRVS